MEKETLKGIFGENAHWQVNKKLAKETSINCAVLLADLFSKSLYFESELDDEGYFFNTRENIENDTTLSPYEQRNCIKILVDKGFLETKEYGLPRKTYYRVVYDKLLKFLTSSSQNFSPLVVKKLHINKNKYNNNKSNNNKDIKEIEKSQEEIDKNKKIADGILLFKKINETGYKKFFGAFPQRKAMMDLLDDYSLQEISEMLEDVCIYNTLPFIKSNDRIYSPFQLQENWQKVKDKQKEIENQIKLNSASLLSKEKVKEEINKSKIIFS